MRRSLRRTPNESTSSGSEGKFRLDERGSTQNSSSENSFKESDSSSAHFDRSKMRPQPKNVTSSSAFAEPVTSSQSIGVDSDLASSNPDITRTYKEKKRMECAESGQLKSMPPTSDHETSFSNKKRLSQ